MVAYPPADSEITQKCSEQNTKCSEHIAFGTHMFGTQNTIVFRTLCVRNTYVRNTNVFRTLRVFFVFRTPCSVFRTHIFCVPNLCVRNTKCSEHMGSEHDCVLC